MCYILKLHTVAILTLILVSITPHSDSKRLRFKSHHDPDARRCFSEGSVCQISPYIQGCCPYKNVGLRISELIMNLKCENNA